MKVGMRIPVIGDFDCDTKRAFKAESVGVRCGNEKYGRIIEKTKTC